MNRALRSRAAVLLLLAGIGCSARGPGPFVGEPAAEEGCAAVHAERVERLRRFGGMTGSGSLRLFSGSARGRASFDFIFRRPDALRLQFRTPLGPVAAVLDIVGGRWIFADFQERYFVRGQGGEAFSRFTGLPAGPETLISVLLAEPRAGDPGLQDLRFHPENCLPLGCRIAGPDGRGSAVTVNYRWSGSRLDAAGEPEHLELPERVVLLGPEPDRESVIRVRRVRPLTMAELDAAPELPDITGLREAEPAGAGGIPGWLQ